MFLKLIIIFYNYKLNLILKNVFSITSNEKVVRGLVDFGLSLLDTSSIHKSK